MAAYYLKKKQSRFFFFFPDLYHRVPFLEHVAQFQLKGMCFLHAQQKHLLVCGTDAIVCGSAAACSSRNAMC